MSSERFTANCKKCGAMFEFGLFSRNHPYCVNCAEELDNEALARIDETEASWTENWPTRTTTSEVERQQGYTKEDHRLNIDDYEKRRKS